MKVKTKLRISIEEKGGAGSGHRGHAGRPGKRGGSMPGSGGVNNAKKAGWESMRRSGISSFVAAGGKTETAEALQSMSRSFLEDAAERMSSMENLRKRPVDWEFYKLIGIELGFRDFLGE